MAAVLIKVVCRLALLITEGPLNLVRVVHSKMKMNINGQFFCILDITLCCINYKVLGIM
jgi:hypothetical protein